MSPLHLPATLLLVSPLLSPTPPHTPPPLLPVLPQISSPLNSAHSSLEATSSMPPYHLTLAHWTPRRKETLSSATGSVRSPVLLQGTTKTKGTTCHLPAITPVSCLPPRGSEVQGAWQQRDNLQAGHMFPCGCKLNPRRTRSDPEAAAAWDSISS